MTEPADFDPETAPSVSLAGKAWPIPELLTWRELSQCRSRLLELTARIHEAIRAAAPARAEPEADREAEPETPAAAALRSATALDGVFSGLSDEDYTRLVVDPVFIALTARHPTLKRGEFEGWPLTEPERQQAWLTVRRHSGLFVFGESPPAGR